MDNESYTSQLRVNGRVPLIQSSESTAGRFSPSPFPRTLSSRGRKEIVDTRDQGPQIKHGILPDYSFRVKGHVHSVLFDPANQCSTVHHSKGMSVYHRRKLEQEIQSDGERNKDVTKLLHASKYGLYVGVCKSRLKLLNSSFVCFYERESETRIVSAVFNTWSGEVITSGPGNITVSLTLNVY